MSKEDFGAQVILLAYVTWIFWPAITFVNDLFFGDRLIQPPAYVSVLADYETRTYASIPCVIRNETSKDFIENREDVSDKNSSLILTDTVEKITVGKIYDDIRGGKAWDRDSVCAQANGFDQVNAPRDEASPLRRWRKDGEWRW